ncbi:MAG TPA: FliH/SctL family protein [Bryobacteraceae bacterium]|jgi:flagellar assembly protein FliH
MSVKVLHGKAAAAAQLVHWPVVDAVTIRGESEPPPVHAPVPPPVIQQDSRKELAALEAELARVKSEAEQKILEASAKGKREGEEAARQSLGANVTAEIEKIRQLSKELLTCGPMLRKQAEGDLARLAVAIARRILHREIQVDHDALLGLIKAALAKVDQREIHIVRTHPDNVDLVQRVLESGRTQKRIEIAGDARLDRGALVIELSRGQLDASVETQLEEIERGFADLVGEQG